MEELDTVQRNIFQRSDLRVCISTPKLIVEIASLMDSHPGLSFEDCSVWCHTSALKGILITGDGKLRKKAAAAGIEVRGIFFLIEELKKQGICEIPECIRLLKLLKSINPRLPGQDIDIRINAWELELANKK